jgi:hypothetical protein
MKHTKEQIDLRNMNLPDQISIVNEGMNKALKGIISFLTTDSSMLGTYALPAALKSKVKCRITPCDTDDEWLITISPSPELI